MCCEFVDSVTATISFHTSRLGRRFEVYSTSGLFVFATLAERATPCQYVMRDKDQERS
jgi:hypothetical protein